ncbi:MAG: hypothetical protein KGJ06_02355 [Pseudomonadota bacterium]|nr:hypothetical protein [Pseudomonadota bacterium]
MKRAAIILVLLATAGCEMIVPPWKVASLEEKADQPVTCAAGADCDEKWGRARQWVRKHSRLQIEKQTDSLLQTAKSLNLSPDVAFVITKVPQGNDTYLITYQADCDDWMGCDPALLKLKASFVNFVMYGKK